MPSLPVIQARPVQPAPLAGSLSVEEAAAHFAAMTAWDAADRDWSSSTAAARKLKMQIEAGGLFCKNNAGIDWYTIAHAVPGPGRRFALLGEADHVVAIDVDPSRLWPLGHRVIETDDANVVIGWRLVGDALVDPSTIPPSEAEMIAYAAARRWRAEVGGCVVDGHQVATDRESQSKLLAEFVAIGGGVRADPSPWKFADGEFASLTNAQMAAVCMGVRAHVAGAFATEGQVLAQITAGTITTTAQIDAAF